MQEIIINFMRLGDLVLKIPGNITEIVTSILWIAEKRLGSVMKCYENIFGAVMV